MGKQLDGRWLDYESREITGETTRVMLEQGLNNEGISKTQNATYEKMKMAPNSIAYEMEENREGFTSKN